MQLFLVRTKRHANNHTDVHYKQITTEQNTYLEQGTQRVWA